MSTTYGLTAAGFVTKPQSQIITEVTATLQGLVGANINLSANSIFTQIIGTFTEREALIWMLAEAIYASQYPAGAEGTSVDNILALNNLRRLPATATTTNPQPVVLDNGITEYGLVLFGTAGTTIPQGSTINTTATPPLTFSLNAAVTIGAAINAIQTVYLSNMPTSGAFSMSIEDPDGNTITTNSIQWNALANQSQISFGSVPSTGSFKIALTLVGNTLTTGSIAFTATASTVQTQIQTLTGYSGVTVSGSFSAGFIITWGAIVNPLVTITSNTLGVTATPTDSAQGIFNGLYDSIEAIYPYTDVQVTSFTTGFVFNFGLGTPVGSNPGSGKQQQALLEIVTNTLVSSSTATNINILTTTMGLPAQAVGSATCTVLAPNFVAANTLSVIGSPTSGWTGVTNQLDCVTGSLIESDTAALIRRSNSLSAQANGPLASIIEQVSQVAGVTAVVGFENIFEAALQTITFGSVPVTGTFTLTVGASTTGSIAYTATASTVQTAIAALSGYSSVLVSGSFSAGFTVDFNGSQGGQPQNAITAGSNTLGVTITFGFGRPGKSFEIVAEGGTAQAIATQILAAKPAGIQAYGTGATASNTVFDVFGNPYTIGFSRPTSVPIFITISLTTDLNTAVNPQFNVGSIQTIQQDLITIGNSIGIGGLTVGFGSNGLIGAFNSVPGILSYTMNFGTSASPNSNANIQMQSEQVPLFETFNIIVSYT